ncbi:MAG: nicotinate-nucleotide diphosphorylase (carboxylating), partial [Phycisphaerae bacterium]
MSLADDECVIRLIELARTEDLGGGDVTAGLMAERGEPAAFVLLAKQAGIFAGREAAPLVLRAYGKSLQIEWSAAGVDGGLLDDVPCPLATIRGPLGVILSAERVLLNFLQRLCGVATLTRQYVDAV